MANRQQQKNALGLLERLTSFVGDISHTINEERKNLDKFRRENPDKFAKDCHIWGLEMPPTQVKVVETMSALATGYVGIRSLYYGLSAATDKVYEKGGVAGVLRQMSGFIRSIFGFGTLGIAVAFLGHALSINPPDNISTGRS